MALNEKVLKKNKELFIDAFNGFGDILSFQTENSSLNNRTKEDLSLLKDKVINAVRLKFSDLDKFLYFYFSYPAWEQYKKQGADYLKRLKSSISYSRGYSFDGVISVAMSQFVRLNKVSIKNSNSEISRYSTYNLVYLLSYLAEGKENEFLIKDIIFSIEEIKDFAIEHNDPSMFSATYHWFMDIVQNNLDNKFNLEYLDLFNKEFLNRSIAYVISKDKKEIFIDFMDTLKCTHIKPMLGFNDYESISYCEMLFGGNRESYYEFKNKLNLYKKCSELDIQKQYFTSVKDIEKWKEEFFNLEKEIINNARLEFDSTEQELLTSEKNKIFDSLENWLKYYNLLEITFVICAFCLMKQEIDYLNIVFSCISRDPHKDDSVFVETPEEFILFFIKRFQSFSDKCMYVIGDNTDSYSNNIFFLALCKMVIVREKEHRLRLSLSTDQELIEDLNFKDFPMNDLSYFKDILSGWIKKFENLLNSEKGIKDLEQYHFNVDDIKNIYLQYLTNLKVKVERELKSKN